MKHIQNMKKLQFQNFRLITPANFSGLGEIHQQQFMLCGGMCYGEEFEDPTEVFAQTYDSRCELWDVTESGDSADILYEVWVFDVDTACVFYAGTDKDTGVGMIQNYFDPIEIDTEETQKLCKALQQAFDEKPEVDFSGENPATEAYRKAVEKLKKNKKE